MDIITSFNNDIKELLKDQFPSDARFVTKFSKPGCIKDEPLEILKNIIQYDVRAIHGAEIQASFNIYNNVGSSVRLFNLPFSISEFNSCCGKAIVHNIKMNNIVYDQSGMKHNEMPQKLFIDACKRIFELIELCLIRMGYSQYDFVLSNVENKDLYCIIEELGFKPLPVFENRRNKYLHTCFTYSKTIRKLDLNEISDRAVENITCQYIR